MAEKLSADPSMCSRKSGTRHLSLHSSNLIGLGACLAACGSTERNCADFQLFEKAKQRHTPQAGA